MVGKYIQNIIIYFYHCINIEMLKQLREWTDENLTREEIERETETYLKNTFEQNLEILIDECNLISVHPHLHLPLRAMVYQYYDLIKQNETHEAYLRYILKDDPK